MRTTGRTPIQPKAARLAFETYVVTEGARVGAFRRAVAARGGPLEGQLDLSRDSLRTLGSWFARPFVPGPEDALEPAWPINIPEGHPYYPERWMLDGLGSYFAAALRRRHPSLTWKLHDDRHDEDYLRPVLTGFRGVRLWAFRPVAGRRQTTMMEANPDADWLVKMFDYYSSIAPSEPTEPEGGSDAAGDLADLLDVEIGPIDGYPDWNADLWITEAAEPILGMAAFEGLEARFAAIQGVERVGWEDREHFLLKLRKNADLDAIREAVRGALREAYEAAQT